MKSTILPIALCSVFFVLISGPAAADNFGWATATSGSWFDPSKWNPASVPGTADRVGIGATGAAYTVTLDSAAAVSILEITSGTATLGGTGTVTVATTAASNLLFNAGTISGLTVNAFNLQMDLFQGQSFLNNAVINITATNGVGGFHWTMQSSLIAQGASRVTILQGARMTLHPTNPTGFGGRGGTATLGTAGGTLQVDINAGGRVLLENAGIGPNTLVIGNGVTVNNAGFFTVTNSFLTISAGGSFNNTGIFTIDPPGGGATPRLTNNGTISSLSGTFTVPNTTDLTTFSSGTLTGGAWRAVNAGFDFGTRAITSLTAGTTVELNGASASFPALNSLIQNTGTLRVLAGAMFNPSTATLNTNGTFEIGSGSVFARLLTVQSGGRLTGTGTVGAPVAVQPGGRLAPGNGIGTLTVTDPVTVNGGTGTTWEIAFEGVAPNTPATASTQAGRLALTGSATLNLSATAANKITLNLTQTGGGLTYGQPVSYVIATAPNGSAFRTDGGAFAFDPNRFAVTAGFGSVTSFELIVVNNNLVFQFVPVPEPAAALGVAGIVLPLAAAVRRLRRLQPVIVCQ